MERSLFHRILNLPNTIKSPFKSRGHTEVATEVVTNLLRLPEYSEALEEVGQVIGGIRGGDKIQNRDLGCSVKNIDITMQVIKEKFEQGVLSRELAQKYLDTLEEQRLLSLQKTPSYRQHLESKINNVLSTPATRRQFLRWSAIGLGSATIASILTVANVSSRPRSTAEQQIDMDKLLDSQPKEELTEFSSDISKEGWRIRLAPSDEKFLNGAGGYMLDNGFGFNFEYKISGDDAIKIRAIKDEQGTIVPFLRVYPQKGTPKDYTIRTNRDKSGDLVTDVVIFENPGRRLKYATQFKVLASGDTFRFAGSYLYDRPLDN